jgi:hypothetical protein
MVIGDSEAFVAKLDYAQAKLNLDIWERIPITYQQEGYSKYERPFSFSDWTIGLYLL